MNNTFSPGKTWKDLGISYLGGCNSPKLEKSLKHNVMTYGVYLAPHTVSGYNVCPQSGNCCKYCLHGSGRNKLELLSNKEGGAITKSRIKKTKLFFEDMETFMQLLIHEITQAKKKAETTGMKFAVRLNCTSDINLEQFTLVARTFSNFSRIPSSTTIPKSSTTRGYQKSMVTTTSLIPLAARTGMNVKP